MEVLPCGADVVNAGVDLGIGLPMVTPVPACEHRWQAVASAAAAVAVAVAVVVAVAER